MLALVKSAFFKYNLSLISHRNAVITFKEPELRIVVGYPVGFDSVISFTIGLSFDDKETGEHFQNVSLM